MSTIDSANPPQEYPDIVGARPTNPLAANFKSFIPASAQLPELTWPHLITGTILGIIFGASSLYLVLKVGLTVSASIPVAVLSITIFRISSKLFRSRDATILQNNIVQTAGSAGESIAFGLGVTMPAIMILGFDLEITRVMLVAVLGGLLGILMMIPLRRALIVAEHGVLKYPEGTACAEVLKAAVSKGITRRRGQDTHDRECGNRKSRSSEWRRQSDLHWFWNRCSLSDRHGRVQNVERHAGENFWCAIKRRFNLRHDRTSFARCRLYHRATDRLDHVRRRRALVSRADSSDQIFR